MNDFKTLEMLNDSELEAVNGGIMICGWFKLLLKAGAGAAIGYAAHEYMA